MRTTLLIDGDIIAYRVAAASETPVNWGDGLWTLHAYEQEVENAATYHVEKLIEQSKCDDVVVCLTGSDNFRKKVCSTYKENRKNTRKPMLLQHAKDFMAAQWNGMVEDVLEADDLLGILGSNSEDNIIWSDDKDLLTIPAQHLLDGKVVTIEEPEADYNFFYQTLTGDSTDNYSGCPKIGPKKAEAILGKESSWRSVVAAFKKQGLSELFALEQARLARILRDGEFNFETKEVKLWTA